MVARHAGSSSVRLLLGIVLRRRGRRKPARPSYVYTHNTLAINRINAAKRDREAAHEDGEAKKIMIIKQAEAEAESKRLSGEGIAQQRLEIVRGFKESVEDFKKSLDSVTHEEIMQFVLMTQYFDTIKDIGANSKNSSILMPHSPGGMREFQNQIISGTFVGTKLNKNDEEADS